ncbi:MAG: molybdenum cofactor cytidylyltransferase [Elusimicrobia bacterium]|nr:MAG: molybdenum cofactor cytidylyltransferase [Elusimicrobiota bacterium]KAF0157153.1 MAG: molybdenum cofactor cytidylyltransferase [Elusimicrobiota bacterium]
MISAIILAAGESSRMGKPKALLEWRGLPFIEHVCVALRGAGVEDRVAVLGRAEAEILAVWTPAGEKVAVNPRPEDGQLSSLRAGLGAADKAAEAFMVCLVDQPTIAPATYRKVIDCWLANKDSIVIPRTFRAADSRMKRGHPVIIPAAHRQLCFEGPLDKGLHWVTHHPSVRIADLDLDDAEIIRDFDTPEDYAGLSGG